VLLEEFKTLLKEANLNLKAFSEVVNTSYSTVAKYGRSNPMPEYVQPFLKLYIENRQLKEVKALIKSLADKL